MAGWRKHDGLAVSLPLADIDTDQLISARFMSAPRSEGYGQFLLHDMRRDEDGNLRPDFPLNAHPNATVLMTRRNFGSGSSREAAVYALVDAGIQAVIAPSFGDIFASNAVNNGLLPARLDEDMCNALERALGPGTSEIHLDLETQTLSCAGIEAIFSLDPSWRMKLINGWDDIDLTRQHQAEIATFRKARQEAHAWAWPATG